MILNDPKNKDNIQEILRQGKVTEFWQVLVQALDDSIVNLQKIQDSDDMKDLPIDQYKVESEILKAKRANLKKLKELPDTLVSWLEQPDQGEKNFDPYYTPEDLSNLLKKV